MSGEARCPLGFTGTPPIGHPVLPGMKGSGGASSGATGDPAPAGSLSATLLQYKPSTLLVVDAVFLGLCIVAAIYRDDLKAIISKFSSSSPASAAVSSAKS